MNQNKETKKKNERGMRCLAALIWVKFCSGGGGGNGFQKTLTWTCSGR